jgi:hypothetical protein
MNESLLDQARPDAALFIDWDNLKVGLKDISRQPNVSSLLDAVNQRGRVVIARAYADWQQRANAFDPPICTRRASSRSMCRFACTMAVP